jgi:hypothetical protein
MDFEEMAYTGDEIGASAEEVLELESQEPLFEGDQGTLPPSARRALTLLIRDAYVCALASPADFETIRNHQDVLTRALNDLGLTLTISPRYEVAYAQQADLDRSGPLMLKKAQPLRRDATILLVSIRVRQHNEEANGEVDWFVGRDELRSLLESGPYAGELDGSRVERALNSAIKQLEEAGYLMSMPTAPDTLRVMPILPAVFTLERAHELLATLTNETQSDAIDNSPREDDDD